MFGWLLILLCSSVQGAHSGAKPKYATHLMVWISSSEPWWSPDNASGYRVLGPGGEMRSIDWLNTSLAEFYLDQVKAAGVSLVIADLTNEFSKFVHRMPALQKLCATRNLAFAAMVAGSAASVEAQAQAVFETLVSDESYFHIDDRPILVTYTDRSTWNALGGNFTDRFALRWSSGEDSNPDKWGWQLERWVGPEPSQQAMYVTPSIGHDPEKDDTKWRKSLAWFDYGMLTAQRSKADVVIVGSYDDVSERNAWLVADTSGAPLERQMRGADGFLSHDVFYARTKEWLTRGAPATVPGGLLPDGFYGIVSEQARGGLMIQDNVAEVAAPLVAVSNSSGPRDVLHWYTSCDQCGRKVCLPDCEPNCCTHVEDVQSSHFVGATMDQLGCGLAVPSDSPLICNGGRIYGQQNGTALLFALYHLGRGRYSILPLNSGLALAPSADGSVQQQWPDGTRNQQWCLRSAGSGFGVCHCEDETACWSLSPDGSVVSTSQEEASSRDVWFFNAVGTLPVTGQLQV